MYNIYKFVSYLIIPIILINVFYRIILNKEDKKRIQERFGKSIIRKPINKKVIWIHAASLGEFKSCDFIIQNYYKSYFLLVTTTTKTAAEYAKKYYGDKIIHQYAPFDIIWWIDRFLKKWNPKLVIWIESDLWPNTIITIKRHNINSIFLNARISPKSYQRWKKYSSYYNYIMDSFNYIYAQSHDDLLRIKSLTNKKVEFIGNLKLTPNAIQNNITEKNNQITIMIGSTHNNEDEMIIPSLINIHNEFKNIKFYIAPRHTDRSLKILTLLKKNGLHSRFESKIKKTSAPFTIIDSFGIMDKYFAKSDIVVLGGSFTKNGGHNPIEAARSNCAIISGSNVFNWKNTYDDMVKANACYKLNNIDELEIKMRDLIINKKLLNKIKKNALIFSKKQFFDQKKLIQVLKKSLNNYA